jgi:hypothetical protein
MICRGIEEIGISIFLAERIKNDTKVYKNETWCHMFPSLSSSLEAMSGLGMTKKTRF